MMKYVKSYVFSLQLLLNKHESMITLGKLPMIYIHVDDAKLIQFTNL